jgi:bifunctional non-homologous end joining protein LigD
MATTERDDIRRTRKPASQSRGIRPNHAARESSAAVAGVRISHPDRLIYPDLGISKIAFAQYYERIAEWIVPTLPPGL